MMAKVGLNEMCFKEITGPLWIKPAILSDTKAQSS